MGLATATHDPYAIIAAANEPQGAPDTPTSVAELKLSVDRYILDPNCLGRGAYGLVFGALDTTTDSRVAVKCIMDEMAESTQDLRMLVREVRLLRLLPHPNILQLTDIVAPTPPSPHTIRLVTPLYDTNLHLVIKHQRLTEDHRRHILISLCRGLAYMHAAGVVHRDVKPANILINADMKLVIADLGFARYLPRGGTRPCSRSVCDARDEAEFSGYVVTRWYRAPELLCGRCAYDATVDSWAVGCVAAEMIRGTPLLPGRDSRDQLKRSVQLLGTPPEAERVVLCADMQMANYIRDVPQLRHDAGTHAAARLAAACPRANDPTEVDLLVRLLAFDPAKRLRVAEALEHDFLRHGHRELREPDLAPPPPPMEMDFDHPHNAPPSSRYLRALLSEEMVRYHPRWRPLLGVCSERDLPSGHSTKKARGREWVEVQ